VANRFSSQKDVNEMIRDQGAMGALLEFMIQFEEMTEVDNAR
jgi:hypothetical protein